MNLSEIFNSIPKYTKPKISDAAVHKSNTQTTNISSLVDLDKTTYYTELPLHLQIAYDVAYRNFNIDDINKVYAERIKINDDAILSIIGNYSTEKDTGVQLYKAIEKNLKAYRNTLYSVYYDMK